MVAWLCAAILVFAAGFHFYWGLGGRLGWRAAIPQQAGGGQPALRPGPLGAHAVGLSLLVAVGLIAARAGWIALPLPALLLQGLIALMALVFLVRALGWFRYAGWFKQVRDTYFARYDTWFYCPLCLVLGLGLARLAWAV